ncbi:MAG: caspase family protein [Bacteroidia bacterium]|nr:caspase family protein [Bacteroidia bacterium]
MPEINRKLYIPSEDGHYFPQRRNHLLAIGIDQYMHCGRLANAVRDVEAFVSLLTNHYDFVPERVRVIKDEAATRQGIMMTLRKLIDDFRVASRGDNLIIFFSGHGHYDEDLQEGYWVPVDAQYDAAVDYIPYSYLQKTLAAIDAHHILLIVDSCYSGAVLVKDNNQAVQRLEADPSRWILASGRNEVVSDGPAGDHSPFAKHLMELLGRRAGKPLPLQSLVADVTQNVIYNAAQAPIGQPLQNVGHRGGQFIFHPIRDEEKEWQKLEGNLQASGSDIHELLKKFEEFLAVWPEGKHAEEAARTLAILKDEANWQKALKINTIVGYSEYRQQNELGSHRADALEKIHLMEEEQVWTNAIRLQSLSGYETYLERYPSGRFSIQAKAKIKEIMSFGSIPRVPEPPLKPPGHPPQWKLRVAGGAVIIAIIIVLLLWRSCGGPPPPTPPSAAQLACDSLLAQEATTATLPDYRRFLQQHPKSPCDSLVRSELREGEGWVAEQFAKLNNSATSRPQLIENKQILTDILKRDTNHTDAKSRLTQVALALEAIEKDPIQALKNKGYTIGNWVTNRAAFTDANGKMGIINSQGKSLCSGYDKIEGLANGYAVFFKNNLCGYLELSTGQEVIAAQYSSAEPFAQNGRAKVKQTNQEFVIDNNGQCVENCITLHLPPLNFNLEVTLVSITCVSEDDDGHAEDLFGVLSAKVQNGNGTPLPILGGKSSILWYRERNNQQHLRKGESYFPNDGVRLFSLRTASSDAKVIIGGNIDEADGSNADDRFNDNGGSNTTRAIKISNIGTSYQTITFDHRSGGSHIRQTWRVRKVFSSN